MAKKYPIILSVDDDVQVLNALNRDIRKQYRKEYKIVSSSNPIEALQFLADAKNEGEEVALIISDQRMPELNGVDFIAKAKEIFPEAKRVLLTAYSDTEAAIKAINEVALDYYLLKPWDPPEERLYPIITDLLGSWDANYIPAYYGLKIIGYQFSPSSHKIKDFLSGNLVPYRFLDISYEREAQEWLEKQSNEGNMPILPIVLFEDGSYLENPSLTDVGQKLGFTPLAKQDLYDVVILGAGPAGLAAAVYGASEGLSTLLIEKRAPGGQAGTSSRIENYLGFPQGLSGSELSKRAIVQATRLGAEMLVPQEVVKLRIQDKLKILTLADGREVIARSLIIATGVDYKKLSFENADKFSGAGIYYGAATTEAVVCREKTVYIVGGGNSAGQAAVYLSRFAKEVKIVIRREDLSSSMSSYLIEQIKLLSNIKLLPYCEVVKAIGEETLTGLVLEDVRNKTQKEVSADVLFVFIGAKPVTEWLTFGISKDEKGYLLTGRELIRAQEFAKVWKHKREPMLLETSEAGIFAAGDVRAGAMNRVASAVGEGAMAIKFVHAYLSAID